MSTTIVINELLTLAIEAIALVDAKENPSHILPLLKRILAKTEVNQELLELSVTDIQKLEQHGKELWYRAISMLDYLDPPSTATYEVIAILREIGYRMTRPAVESYTAASGGFWIFQLEMTNALGRAWIDNGNYDRADAAFRDAEHYDAQLEAVGPLIEMNKVMFQASARMKFYMFRAELELRRDNWEKAKILFSEAVDYCVSNRQILDDENNIKNKFLCQIGIVISQKMLDDSKPEGCLTLIAQVFSKLKYGSCTEKFMQTVLETIAHATLNMTTPSLSSPLQITLIELIQNIAHTFSDIQGSKEYHLAKLSVLSKCELFHKKEESDNSIMLEIAYFEAMENFPLNTTSPWICYLVTFARLMLGCSLSIETIHDGLDILLQRRRAVNLEQDVNMDQYDDNNTTSLINIGKLYQTKLFLLSEVMSHHHLHQIHSKNDFTETTSSIVDALLPDNVIESIDRSLTKTMNDLFVDKDEVDPLDITVCQMVSILTKSRARLLWQIGDTFYDKQDYANAIQWYKHTRVLCMTLFKGSKNGLILARQLSQCYALNGQPDNALDCLSEAMEDCSEYCVAADHLLKAGIYIKKGDKSNIDNSNNNSTVKQVLLCLEKAQKTNGFAFDMFLALASCVFESSMPLAGKKLILHKITEESVTLLMKTHDAEILHSTHIVQVLQILRWIVCSSNSYEQLAVLQHRDLKEETAENIQEICETIHQASDLVCKALAENTDHSPSTELQSLSEWFISAAWNLGLQCCERAMEDRGRRFLLLAGKLIQVTGNNNVETMDDRQRISLFMGIVARQLSGDGQISDHQEILSLAQKLAVATINEDEDEEEELQPPSKRQEAFNGLLQIFQVEALVSLSRFDEAIQIVDNCCKAASTLSHLCLCERIVESVLQSQHCSKQDTFKVLECIIALYRKQYPEQNEQTSRPFIERYSKWNRLLVSTAMSITKETGFQCLEATCQHLKQRGSIGYPESQLYYLVVVAWNEGITWFHANDSNRGTAWCKLAFDLLSFFNDTHRRDTLKHKLTQAYAELTNA